MPEVKFEDVPEDEAAEFGRSPPGRGLPSAAILPPHVLLPTQPPYKAYLKNLPFNVTEEDLVGFFRDLTVRLQHVLALCSCPCLLRAVLVCMVQLVTRVLLLILSRPHAQVQDVHLLTHQDTGKLRGCFVAFATAEEVGLAVARDGSVSNDLRKNMMPRIMHVDSVQHTTRWLSVMSKGPYARFSRGSHVKLRPCLAEVSPTDTLLCFADPDGPAHTHRGGGGEARPPRRAYLHSLACLCTHAPRCTCSPSWGLLDLAAAHFAICRYLCPDHAQRAIRHPTELSYSNMPRTAELLYCWLIMARAQP